MVTAAHDLPDFVDAFLYLCGGSGAHRDAQGILLIAVLLVVGAEGQDDPIVQRRAERGTLFFADADDLARCVVPADLFAERVDSGHEIFHQVLADDTDGGGALKVGFGDVAAGDQIDVVELGHLRSPGA